VNLSAAALGTATAAALLARHWWAFDLFSHFRPQYAALAAVLCPAALALRARPAAALLGAVALIHGWAVKDLWLGGEEAAGRGGLPLRIASANVLASNPTPERLLDFALASQPDLLLVVDAADARWRGVLAELDALYPHRAPVGDLREGAPLILFSRLPIRAAGEVPTAGQRPRLLAELVLDGSGRTLTLVGVHPSSPSPTDPRDSWVRNLQLDGLAERVERAGSPVIVAGDFNTSPWSPHFRALLSTTRLRNAAKGGGWIATWPSWLWWPARIPIDHVLVGGPVGVVSLETGPFIGSDHYPIVADLRLNPSRPHRDRRP
jgi:endonuclease/exonuclease/phosphatase (EEP) superfamily protein YafD